MARLSSGLKKLETVITEKNEEVLRIFGNLLDT